MPVEESILRPLKDKMETEFEYRLIGIIEAPVKDIAAQKALEWDAKGGEKTFSVPLSPTGKSPATHYGCETAATREMALKMIEVMPLVGSIQFFNMRTWPGFDAVLKHLGLQRIIEEPLSEKPAKAVGG